MNKITKRAITILIPTICLGIKILLGIDNTDANAKKTDDIGIVNISDEQLKNYYNLGRENKKDLEKLGSQEWNKQILDTDNEIDQGKVDIISDGLAEMGEENVTDVAENVKSSQALYIAAKAENIEASEKEIDTIIDYLRSLCAEEDNEMGDCMKAYCKGAGITLEEYFEYLRPFYEKRIVISKYVEKNVDPKLEKEQITPGTMEAIELQNDVQQNLEKKAVERYGVEIVTE